MANIHLEYVRIPGKGITLHRLLWGDDDDDTIEISISNVISKKIIVFDFIKSGMKVKSGKGNSY